MNVSDRHCEPLIFNIIINNRSIYSFTSIFQQSCIKSSVPCNSAGGHFVLFLLFLTCQSCELHGLSAPYLRVGELQPGDGEHHLSCGDEEILRDLQGQGDRVWTHVHHLLDVCALQDKRGTFTSDTTIKKKSESLKSELLSYLISKCYIGANEHCVRASVSERLGEHTRPSILSRYLIGHTAITESALRITHVHVHVVAQTEETGTYCPECNS